MKVKFSLYSNSHALSGLRKNLRLSVKKTNYQVSASATRMTAAASCKRNWLDCLNHVFNHVCNRLKQNREPACNGLVIEKSF